MSDNGYGILLICFASFLTGYFQGIGVFPVYVGMAVLAVVGWLSGHFGKAGASQ